MQILYEPPPLCQPHIRCSTNHNSKTTILYMFVCVGLVDGNPHFLCRREQKVIIRIVNRKIVMLSYIHALHIILYLHETWEHCFYTHYLRIGIGTGIKRKKSSEWNKLYDFFRHYAIIYYHCRWFAARRTIITSKYIRADIAMAVSFVVKLISNKNFPIIWIQE